MASKSKQSGISLPASLLIAILSLLAISTFLAKHLLPSLFLQKQLFLTCMGILTFSLTGAALTTWVIVHASFMNPLQRVIHNIKVLRLGQVDRLKLTDSSLEMAEINREFIQLYDALVRTRSNLNIVNHNVKDMISFHTEQFRRDIRLLKQKINVDSLTGLSNRGHLDAQLPVFYDHAQKSDLDLACLMIDIDHFKSVNDALGHATGDELIYFVGELLQGSVRDCDFVARYGGDEFAILMLDTSGADAMVVAERIRQMFAHETQRFVPTLPSLHEQQSHLLCPKLSIGLSTLKNSAPLNPGHLLQLADDSLYQAKRSGRNCVKAG
jgi:diguanylate cyclase (GGDEF)-like protein